MGDSNENKPKVENKIDVKVALSWGIPWFAGTLFTMGFSPLAQTTDLWANLAHWLFYFVAWPLILGRKLGSPPV
jgi:hypothetical protein